MRVIIGCERSGVIREAFRKLGHDAWSCDLEPADDNSPYHIKEDVIKVIQHPHRYGEQPYYSTDGATWKWDLGIFHPPCDNIAICGARWFPEKRADGRQQAAIEFFMKFSDLYIPRVAIENPVGIMSGKRLYLKKHFPDLYEKSKCLPTPQYIQPWEYGHGETKKTCLWLKNLPKLIPIDIVEGREARVHKMPPSDHRAQDRARTYEGWAKAMAEQWGCLI